MPNANYLKGRRLEYERRKAWEANGYICLRTAGSHGFADLIAVRPGDRVFFIQVKAVETEAQMERLQKKFRDSPPILDSKFYHLCLEVKVKGGKVEQTFV